MGSKIQMVAQARKWRGRSIRRLTALAEDEVESLFLEADALRNALGLRASTAAVLNAVMNNPCPARCVAELRSYEHRKIDPFYTERHRFLQRLLVDALRTKLQNKSINTVMVIENETGSDKGDVGVSITAGGAELPAGGKITRVELRAGENFAISQVLRYLLDAEFLILRSAGPTWSDDKALTTFEMKSSLPPRYSPRRVRLELIREDEIYYIVRDPLRLTHWIPRLRWKIVKEERPRPRRSQAEGKV